MDGGVVQVIPVGRSLDEGVSQLVCAAAWDFVGPIVVPYAVTNGVGCNVVRLLSCSNESDQFLLSPFFFSGGSAGASPSTTLNRYSLKRMHP